MIPSWMLQVLPANIRLDWKVIARYKHSSLFGLIISNKEKKFYIIDTRSNWTASSVNKIPGGRTYSWGLSVDWQNFPRIIVFSQLFFKKTNALNFAASGIFCATTLPIWRHLNAQLFLSSWFQSCRIYYSWTGN
jgi:hypothetical protein